MKQPEAVFISAEEAEKAGDSAESKELVVERQPWEETLAKLSNRDTTRICIPKNDQFKRNQVVDAFHDAFQLIGGVPRLTLWANENEGAFYALYAKLLPKQVAQDINHEGGMKIVHVLPKTSLDGE